MLFEKRRLLHVHFLPLFPQVLLLLPLNVVIQFASLSQFLVFVNLKCVSCEKK